jgi:hypothetical protein
MDIVATMGAAYSSGKALIEVLKGLEKLKLDTEVSTRVFDALQKANDMQQQLFEARDSLFGLQTENQELRRQIKDHDDWEAIRRKYKLVETIRGGKVYESIDTSPLHHACPRCFVKHEIQILQDPVGDTYYRSGCPGCGSLYAIKPERHVEPTRVESDYDPRG